MKLESKIESEQSDTTKSIPRRLKENEWTIIDGVKKWTRNCPQANCKNVVTYVNFGGYLRAIRQNRNCLSCRTKFNNEKTNLSRSQKMTNWMLNLSPENKEKYKKANERRRGIKKSTEICRNISIATKIAMNRSETRKKLRIAYVNDMSTKHGKLCPNYNHWACVYLDALNLDTGWNIQHAENGGEFYIKELGYWVDGYDQKRNIVVEYFENKHYNKNLSYKERDIRRLNEIKDFLRCQMFIFNEQKNKLELYE